MLLHELGMTRRGSRLLGATHRLVIMKASGLHEHTGPTTHPVIPSGVEESRSMGVTRSLDTVRRLTPSRGATSRARDDGGVFGGLRSFMYSVWRGEVRNTAMLHALGMPEEVFVRLHCFTCTG